MKATRTAKNGIPQRRWAPPPMERQSSELQSRIRIDERVVRKMLVVNPDMRKGRTTFQVKKAFEAGEAVSSGPTPLAPELSVCARGPIGGEFGDTIDFFVRGKAQRLSALETELADRRRAIEEMERAAKSEMARELRSFIGLLDPAAVAEQGKLALGKHAELLKKLGMTPAELLRQVGQRRK